MANCGLPAARRRTPAECLAVLEGSSESVVTRETALDAARDLAAWVAEAEQDDLGFVMSAAEAERLVMLRCDDQVLRAVRAMYQVALPAVVMFLRAFERMDSACESSQEEDD